MPVRVGGQHIANVGRRPSLRTLQTGGGAVAFLSIALDSTPSPKPRPEPVPRVGLVCQGRGRCSSGVRQLCVRLPQAAWPKLVSSVFQVVLRVLMGISAPDFTGRSAWHSELLATGPPERQLPRRQIAEVGGPHRVGTCRPLLVEADVGGASPSGQVSPPRAVADMRQPPRQSSRAAPSRAPVLNPRV